MARSNGDNGSAAGNQPTDTLTFQADGAERIDLPSTGFIAEANMTRQSGDLILQTPDGETVVIEGYFNADPAPVLHGPDGSVLTPNLVDSFVRSPLEFAAGQTANDESPVGAVEEVKGSATVTRADGTVETITNGTPIYQGDIIETDASGAVNIVFLDETSMAVSANARLAIDEYTFDPATESGTTNFSVLRGLFVFTSGLIGRDDPDDVKIETPVGSIGIRGTIIAGEIIPGGESKISVLEGAIVIKNGMGEVTLSEQFETVSLSGYDQPMQNIGAQSASDIGARFSSIGDVNPSLFSVIGESAKEQSVPTQTQEAPKVDAAPEQPSSSSTPESSAQSQASVSPPPAPAQAPDVFASVTDAPPSLHTETSNGLPSTSVVHGQPSGGLIDSGTTTLPSTSAPTTPVATAPPASTAPSAPSSGSAAPETPVTPPAVLESNGPAPVASTASLSFTGGTITDFVGESHIVGHLSVHNGTATSYSFASGSNTNGYYRLESDGQGGMNVVLTDPGADALAESLDTVQLGGFDIIVELEDADSITQSFSVTVTDTNAATRINLDAPATGVAILTDNYADGSGNGRGFGYTISALGDTNGDGFDDFIVSNGLNAAGHNSLYRFLGGSGQYASNDLSHAGIAPTITPIMGSAGNFGDTVVHAVNDFNGDGIMDYVVGQPYSSVGGIQSGNAFIVNGADPSQYLTFASGLTAGIEIGYSVSSILDFNNDGHSDVIIGAPGAGRVFVSQGYSTGSWSGGITPSMFVEAPGGGAEFGRSITGIGDFNGDGYSDFAVGAPSTGGTAGAVYIYSGNTNGSLGTALHTISGTTDEMLGTEVASAGDFNGDGLTDLLVAGGDSVSLMLGTEGTPMRNMTFFGSGYTFLGGGGIGDFNGDGYDDFVLSLGEGTTSKSYIVFGGELATDEHHQISSLNYLKNPNNAIEIVYNGANNTDSMHVSRIGDINGDGFDDFAMGLPDANGAADGDGGIAIIYGRDTGAVNMPGETSALLNNQVLVGTATNDFFHDATMIGTSMRGGAGNDTFRVTNTDFRNIDGGSGHDLITAAGDSLSLDFSNIDFERISRIESITFGGNDQTITLTLENLFNLMKSSDEGQLYLDRSSTSFNGMQLVLTDGDGFDNYAGSDNGLTDIATMLDNYSSGTVTTGTQTTGGSTYNTFAIGGYMLLIDQAITVDAQ